MCTFKSARFLMVTGPIVEVHFRVVWMMIVCPLVLRSLRCCTTSTTGAQVLDGVVSSRALVK
jgi:hypothetical protein